MAKKPVKKLLSVPPKFNQLKDIVRQYNLNLSLTDIQRLVAYAVPELGKQLAKNGNTRYFADTIQNIGKLTEITEDAESLTSYMGNARNEAIQKDLGFQDFRWENKTNDCGMMRSCADLDDLYESNLEVEIAIVVRRKVKPKECLTVYGVK